MVHIFRKAWLSVLVSLLCGMALTYSLQLANLANDGAAMAGILVALGCLFGWALVMKRIWRDEIARIAQEVEQHR